jgi:uncharacterized protein YlzI (FlbEa/FlbD family)
MATILVETRGELRCNPILDTIARVCETSGHRVFRWRGPLSGRINVSRRLRACDLAILFNGAHAKYRPAVDRLRERGTPTLFVEFGWHPQLGTIQIDARGINAWAAWVAEPLGSIGRQPLALQDGDLLVALQHDRDTQITQHSPWFKNMVEFVEHVARASAMPVRLRRHPRHAVDERLFAVAEQWGCVWDESPSFSAALQTCRAVACVNSSSGVEALSRGMPVLCYGEAIYRHAGAVYCLNDDLEATTSVTEELKAGVCSVFQERVHEVLSRIAEHQWRVEEIGERLPGLITAILEQAGPRPSSVWMPWPLRSLAKLTGLVVKEPAVTPAAKEAA